jgi:hypothetical protein
MSSAAASPDGNGMIGFAVGLHHGSTVQAVGELAGDMSPPMPSASLDACGSGAAG